MDESNIKYIEKGESFSRQTLNRPPEHLADEIKTEFENLNVPDFSYDEFDGVRYDLSAAQTNFDNHLSSPDHNEYFQISNELSEGNPADMRTNLGMGEAATDKVEKYVIKDFTARSDSIFNGSKTDVTESDIHGSLTPGLYVLVTDDPEPDIQLQIYIHETGTNSVGGTYIAASSLIINHARWDGNAFQISSYTQSTGLSFVNIKNIYKIGLNPNVI